jgi:phospholipid/cholesterol/gamma-HCH transport system substrate-binding protein
MNLRIPRAGALFLVVAVAIATALFVYFLGSFGGPAIRLSEPYRVSAVVPDTRGLVTRSEVLVRGVRVGEVASVEPVGDQARVTLEIDERYAPLDAGATIRIGAKTLFGESYVDLDPGEDTEPDLASGKALDPDAVLPEAVDVDEALSAFTPQAREDLSTVIGAAGDGVAPAGSSERVSNTVAELSRVTAELRQVTEELDGQEEAIAAGVRDAGSLFEALADDEAVLRGIVADANTTLNALGGSSDSLRAGLNELPRLIAAAQETLTEARPLVTEARPLAGQLATAAPTLREALADLPPIAEDADALLAGIPQLETVATPFLSSVTTTLKLAEPLTEPLTDALRNVEPVARYLSARKEAFAAWFSNTADLGSHRDAKGYFARFFVGFEPTTASGTPGGDYEVNSYTGPKDALDPQPYSGYERLEPYDPYQNDGE